MKNIFLYLDGITARTVAFELDYVLGVPINSIILLAENHNSDELLFVGLNKKVCIYNTLDECINKCDIIITSQDLSSVRLKQVRDKHIIKLNLSPNYSNESKPEIPQLDNTNKPVIAILSLGRFTNQYYIEIIISKILSESTATVCQHFSANTRNILDSFSQANSMNSFLSMPKGDDFDVIVVSKNEFENYSDLLKTISTLSPDVLIVCVNYSYNEESKLIQMLRGICNIDAIVRSPYLPYEIVEGKVYPVYCGVKRNELYTSSLQSNLYDVLNDCIMKRIYLPRDVKIL